MSTTLPNVCLAKEPSRPHVYFVCGGTKMWIPDPADFAAVGFRGDKIRTVPDGTLERYVEKPFVPPAATKASDVFLAPRTESNPWSDLNPFHWGRWFPNRQQLESLTVRNAIVVGWLEWDPEAHLVPWGCEDVFYNVWLDPDFVTRMYGPGGLSTLLNGQSYKGNLGGFPGTPKPLPVEDRSPVDGSSTGVTFNSFILPGGDSKTHGELNAWHVSDTSGDSGTQNWPNHFIGRGAAPDGWTQIEVKGLATAPTVPDPVFTTDLPWFPWDIFAPSGDRLRAGDYVMMRGPIWQDMVHGNGASPPTDWWHTGATLGHEGWVEMHPIDWIVRLQPRPPGLRKTGHWLGRPTPAGQDWDESEAKTIRPRSDDLREFKPSAPTRVLTARGVEEIVDGRCSDMGTVIPHAELGSDRWKNLGDHVDIAMTVRGTPQRQGRFKASYIVSWRETDKHDTVWVDDALPAGASEGDEPWTWVTDNPKPYSGGQSHRSASMAGMHQQFFNGASDQLAVADGDLLFAMVYIDPDDTPSELMLQWNDGSWEHRAYWGDDEIKWGVNDTGSRRPMGPLPESGAWIRLEVPAAAVGLAGRSVKGMAFTLWSGRATWDYAGKRTVPPPPPPLDLNAAFVSQDVPPDAFWGGKIDLSVTMRNTGQSQWTQTAGVALGWPNPPSGWIVVPSASLPVASVPSGQEVTFSFTVVAPTKPPTTAGGAFQWRMRSPAGWFGAATPSVQIVMSFEIDF